MGHKVIAAAEALKLFRGQRIEVQDAKPVKVKGEDGVERQAFKTEMKPLSADLVLSAKQYDDGKVTITTIDGRRYEAKGEAPEEKSTDKGAGK